MSSALTAAWACSSGFPTRITGAVSRSRRASARTLPRETQGGLERLELRNGLVRVALAEAVERQEARKVLHGAVDLVPTDGGRGDLERCAQRGVQDHLVEDGRLRDGQLRSGSAAVQRAGHAPCREMEGGERDPASYSKSCAGEILDEEPTYSG